MMLRPCFTKLSECCIWQTAVYFNTNVSLVEVKLRRHNTFLFGPDKKNAPAALLGLFGACSLLNQKHANTRATRKTSHHTISAKMGINSQ